MFATPRRTIAAATFSLAALLASAAGPTSRAEEAGPVVVPPPSGRLPVLGLSGPSAPTDPEAARPSGGGWWLGTSGIALALAACGAASVAARRYRPQGSSGMVNVVGKVSLSPRHSIVLVRAGARVLLVGTGPQGAPSLLGELEGEALPLAADGTPRAGGEA
ncbi:Flagellar biosynthesis protein, FliO [Aquisphaera giovannonii]|uniref:Flagellar biosynthesis protein, FliO n=1 Tax=Aquisphaera giovannonii TaxID=406548 RepID=A0A5B9W6I6_9BACT|nr:flagellar biosynthetic protein FliO [Aquisphaera giovannonii]QEH35745.1 Flagellar biosynthesis protein, FliO [Aquisphaera giovannonii]